MNKKIISAILCGMIGISLTPNIAHAELFNITSPGQISPANPTSPEYTTAINVIKHLGVSLDSKPESGYELTFTGDYKLNGQAQQGNNGLSVAFAYLTPQKKFGLITRTDINLRNSNGTNNLVSDPENVWTRFKKETGVKTFYNNAVDDFQNSTKIKESLDIDESDIINGNVLTQTSDKGREFIAATLYVRWFYDTISGRTLTDDLYMRELPVLKDYTTTQKGPFIGWGDYFDSTIRMIPKSGDSSTFIDDQRKKVTSNAHKYIRTLSSCVVGGLGKDKTYLTEDPYYTNDSSVKIKNKDNNKAMFEKRIEYRRYFKRGTSNTSGDTFEIVYPVEKLATLENTSKATTGLKASVKANTIFKDATNTEVEKYEFDVKIEPFKPTTTELNRSESPKTYPVYHKKTNPVTSPTGEPPEDKADVWHDIISRTFEIKDHDGNSIEIKDQNGNYTKKLKLNNNDETITLSPEDVGYKNLSSYRAVVSIEYKTLTRYMAKKEVYTYTYDWKDKIGDIKNYEYSEVYEKLHNNNLTITSGFDEVKKYHNNSEPRTIFTYQTSGGDAPAQNKEVYDVIIGPNGGDSLSPELNVEVNPPNALTVLEGGKFDINLEFDTKGISIGKETAETRKWIENFEVRPTIVKAQNGDIIYRNDNVINNFTNADLTESILGVTAKPNHVGKATVEVHYTYTLVEEVYKRDDVVDANGNVTQGDEYLVRVDRTENKGQAKGYFNIYSLTANTAQ